jgi:speckle-type POZ protein
LADKYNLPRLKSVCEEAICDDIDIGNAVHSLILGHLHEAKNLKATALEYVSTNLVNKVFFVEFL